MKTYLASLRLHSFYKLSEMLLLLKRYFFLSNFLIIPKTFMREREREDDIRRIALFNN